MFQSSSICIKILSLAVVLWATVSGSALKLQNAVWLPWMALILLMLLEAYTADSQPASWSRWSAGLRHLLGPAMLPFYLVLSVCLAFGPDHTARKIPQSAGVGVSVPAPIAPKVSGSSFQSPLSNSPQVPPSGAPAAHPSRPAVNFTNAPAPVGARPPGNLGAPVRPQAFVPSGGGFKSSAPNSAKPVIAPAPAKPAPGNEPAK